MIYFKSLLRHIGINLNLNMSRVYSKKISLIIFFGNIANCLYNCH